MYYSVTFENSSGEKRNTWADWQLIPFSPPMIEPPEVYTNYVDIPGRPFGPIDLSEALSNGPSYQNSEGSWEFISAIDYEKRPEMYQELKKFLHGQTVRIRLEEDPDHYYKGRMFVEKPKTGNGHNIYSFKYIINPIRYLSNDTPDGI